MRRDIEESTSKKRPWQKRISIAFGVYSVALYAIIVRYLLANRSYVADGDVRFEEMLMSVAILSFLGFLLSYRRPQNSISWLFVLVAFMRQAGIASTIVDTMLVKGTEPTFWLLVIGNLWIWLSALTYTILAYAIVLFPNGRLPSSRWRSANWLLGLEALLTAGLIYYFVRDLQQFFAALPAESGGVVLVPPTESGPLSIGARYVRAVPGLNPYMTVIALVALVMVLTGLLSQIIRFRSGDSIERQQVKWIIFALILWALALFLIFGPAETSFQILVIVSPIIPICIAVAILRYRLFDIDLIIRRTLVYGVLTGLLVIVYFGTVTLLQAVVTALTGQASPIIIVVSTLVIAALFSPLRRRTQQAIDRRFYRQKYNAELILAQFAETARDEVNLEALAAELLRVTQESLQPEIAALWLKPKTKKQKGIYDVD